MTDDPRLRTLLERREAMRQRGETVCLEALCENCPELLPALRRQIEQGDSQPAVPGTLELPGPLSSGVTPGTVVSGSSGIAEQAETLHTTCPVQVPGYDLLEELGRGGMGVVYKARHLKLNRIVALKMVLAGAHAGPQQLARFQIEAESVASLHHSNIVQVYEVGEHDRCPYLALEFVDGGGLDRKLAGQRMPPRAAAHLVEQLARAMHVAHLRGIIHRDLKPANVLLTGDGTPKISDFGLAKKLDEGSSQTHSGSVLGTPSYMAPEQALGKVREIGPHSDVYSLGAILYECLTGEPPFRADSVMQTLTLVQTEEVKPPSQVAGVPLPRDLETVCVKCLQKNVSRRYASAEELADELRRFLNQEPIEARPAGRLERLALWAKRRPALAGLVSVSFFAMAAVLGMGVWSHIQVRTALRRAENSLTRAREAIDSFYVQFAEEWLDDAAHMDEQQERFINKALSHYEELSREEGRDPSLRRDQGQALMRMGQIYTKLDRKAEAEAVFKRAFGIQEELAGDAPDERRYRQDLANTHNWFGELLRITKRPEQAQRHYEEAMKIQRGLLEADAEEASYRHELARSSYNRGLVREDKDKTGAREDFEAAIELLKPLARGESDNPAPRLDLAKAHLNLGGLLRDVGDAGRSRREYGRAVARLSPLVQQYPGKAEYRFELAKANKNLGNLEERNLGNFAAALAAHGAACKLLDRLADDFPSRPRYQQEQGRAYLSLGAVQSRMGHDKDAEKSWLRAVEVFRELTKRGPEDAEYLHESGLALRTLGWFYLRVRREPALALPPLRESETALRSASARASERAEYRRDLREALRFLADASLMVGFARRAAESAEETARGSEASSKELYQAAALLARCAAAVEQNHTAGTLDERKALAGQYADGAMKALQRADPKQFQKALLADKDLTFRALRGRQDFKQLLERLEAMPVP